MPELPEVQTTVNDLQKKIIGRRIVNIWHNSPKQISVLGAMQSPEKAIGTLKHLPITAIERRGKYIFIFFGKHEKIILIHLKLTGRLLVGRWKIEKRGSVLRIDEKRQIKTLQDYIRVIFYFENGDMLGFSDVRRFGRIVIGDSASIFALRVLRSLGPEPLSTEPHELQQRIASRKKSIKQTLLDQTVIAGIGNIYADETLWLAGVHPKKSAHHLSEGEHRRIFKAMHLTLTNAIRLRGTSFRDFRDTEGEPGAYKDKLAVYQRDGAPCRRCADTIQRIMLGGRSTHFCPSCQTE